VISFPTTPYKQLANNPEYTEKVEERLNSKHEAVKESDKRITELKQ
jgi:hypothetical protein